MLKEGDVVLDDSGERDRFFVVPGGALKKFVDELFDRPERARASIAVVVDDLAFPMNDDRRVDGRLIGRRSAEVAGKGLETHILDKLGEAREIRDRDRSGVMSFALDGDNAVVGEAAIRLNGCRVDRTCPEATAPLDADLRYAVEVGRIRISPPPIRVRSRLPLIQG